MEGKVLLVQLLLVGAAWCQSGQLRTFSFSEPPSQPQDTRLPSQPIGEVFQKALQHHLGPAGRHQQPQQVQPQQPPLFQQQQPQQFQRQPQPFQQQPQPFQQQPQQFQRQPQPIQQQPQPFQQQPQQFQRQPQQLQQQPQELQSPQQDLQRQSQIFKETQQLFAGHSPSTATAANTQNFEQGAESFQFINTRSKQPAQTAVQQTVDRAHQTVISQPAVFDLPRSDATHQPFQQQQFARPLSQTASIPSFADAVPAPVQQHDAQVFTRKPAPGSPIPSVAVPVQQHDPTFTRRPAAPTQQPLHDTFASRQSQEQTLPQAQDDGSFGQFEQDEPQQDILRFQQEAQQQVLRTKPATRSRGPAAVPTTVRRPTSAPTAQMAVQAVHTRPTVIQVPDATNGQLTLNEEADELFREQAENAKYTFASAVDDRLKDSSQVRQETRDGLNLAGLYSYSDGFFRRTVHYEADENGYRVTKEEVEPIGDGPQPDPQGSADVATQVAGTDVRYTITADDIQTPRQDVQQLRQSQQSDQAFQGDFAA